MSEDVTRKLYVVLENDQGYYNSVRAVVRGVLQQHGRFEEEPDELFMEYDRMCGDAIRAWVGNEIDAESDLQKALWREFMSMVDWAEYAKDVHNEVAAEYNERYPEHNIKMPEKL